MSWGGGGGSVDNTRTFPIRRVYSHGLDSNQDFTSTGHRDSNLLNQRGAVLNSGCHQKPGVREGMRGMWTYRLSDYRSHEGRHVYGRHGVGGGRKGGVAAGGNKQAREWVWREEQPYILIIKKQMQRAREEGKSNQI